MPVSSEEASFDEVREHRHVYPLVVLSNNILSCLILSNIEEGRDGIFNINIQQE